MAGKMPSTAQVMAKAQKNLKATTPGGSTTMKPKAKRARKVRGGTPAARNQLRQNTQIQKKIDRSAMY